MKAIIRTFAIGVIGTMAVATTVASLTEAIWKIPKNVTGDPWFKATLLDAYFGFLTFYGWLYYRERNPSARLLWFVLIMLGGNAAMSTYLLIQLAKLPDDASFADLLIATNPEGKPSKESDSTRVTSA